MVKAQRDIINALIVIAFAVVLYVEAGKIPDPTAQQAGPTFFPKAVVPVLGVLGLALLAQSVARVLRKDNETLDTDIRSIVHDNARVLLVLAATVLYVVGLYFIGYMVATPVYMVAVYRVISAGNAGKRWWVTVGGYLIFTFVIYAIFRFALSVFLPMGLW